MALQKNQRYSKRGQHFKKEKKKKKKKGRQHIEINQIKDISRTKETEPASFVKEDHGEDLRLKTTQQ